VILQVVCNWKLLGDWATLEILEFVKYSKTVKHLLILLKYHMHLLLPTWWISTKNMACIERWTRRQCVCDLIRICLQNHIWRTCSSKDQAAQKMNEGEAKSHTEAISKNSHQQSLCLPKMRGPHRLPWSCAAAYNFSWPLFFISLFHNAMFAYWLLQSLVHSIWRMIRPDLASHLRDKST